jgi:TonB family protein
MLKYRSRIRIFLFTFLVGVFLTGAYARLNAYIDAMTAEIPNVNVDELRIKLPVINSDSPLIVRPETDKFTSCCGGGGAGGGGAKTSVTTSPLYITSKPLARYTDLAREQNLEGTVILRVTFSEDGSVSDIQVVQGLGYGLTEQAIGAAKQIVFRPKEINGTPVSITKTVEYNFNIY